MSYKEQRRRAQRCPFSTRDAKMAPREVRRAVMRSAKPQDAREKIAMSGDMPLATAR
jgi:hypothetical protein